MAGEAQQDYPPLPFFVDDVGGDLHNTSEASYILPYHYSRMVETNLDIHHTPFVHGSVVPVGTRTELFDVGINDNHIYTRGELRRENAESGQGLAFRAELKLPCVSFIQLTPKLHILAAATPVDDTNTWMWFRYYQHYTQIPGLRKLVAWLSVQSELRVVQRQDWEIFGAMQAGTIDDVPYRFVQADRGIMMYRKKRRELLAAQAPYAKAS
ncbi:MAG: hypothetical protein AAF512_18715 [Pseudomonadota bacterium]